ncbi:MAG: hypothetical protein KBE23_14035 [Chloroflexi bacterium]|nr:hypothetical protein [Chloroflexota bacterium]MBP7043860.1 hypothetical protein [Chloroflexota bacterium]
MPTYFELAQALADAGYVSDADIQAAVDILTDALIIEAAEAVEAEAMDDYSEQEDLIAKAENWVAEDAVAGHVELAEIDTDIIVDAADQALADRDKVIIAEAVIDAAYEDAAAALLAAEIIDAANVTAVAALLADL